MPAMYPMRLPRTCTPIDQLITRGARQSSISRLGSHLWGLLRSGRYSSPSANMPEATLLQDKIIDNIPADMGYAWLAWKKAGCVP
jgi:hypothetical protein